VAVIRLYRDSDGELRFPNSAVARSPRLRRYVEQKRLEGERQHAEHERLHAEHMPFLGEADPTGMREVRHRVR
jgi:hypothetical protein